MSDGDDLKSAESGQHIALRRDVELRSSTDVGSHPARPVVLVLGMHRSGTSLLSNALHLLGVDMADTTDHISPKNAGGFWERPELVAIHDEILEAIGRPIGRPSHVLPLPPAWWRSKEVQALKPKLAAYVRDELAKSSNPWGFKDPRTCRLLPLWGEIFRELNLQPVYVTAIRHPSESSVSMSRKSPKRHMSVANGELMWLSYNYDVARHVLAKSPSVVVHYNDWFEDADAVARRLSDALGIGHDLSDEELSECMATVVRRDLRNQVDGEEGVVSRVPIATMLFDAIDGLQDGGSREMAALRAQLRLVDLFFKSMAPVAADLDDAAAQAAELKAGLEQAAEQAGTAQDQLTEAESAKQQALAEREALAVDLAQAKEEHAALESERQTLTERLAEAQAEIDEARAALEAGLVVTAEQQAAELEAKLAEAAALFEDERASIVAQFEAELAEASAEGAKFRDERDAAVRTVEGALGEARGLIEQERASYLEETEVQLSELRSDLERTRSELDRGRTTARLRIQFLLDKAKEWRSSYRAEHGQPQLRIDAAANVMRLERLVAELQEDLAKAEEQSRGLIDELDARDRAIARLRRHAEHRNGAEINGVFDPQLWGGAQLSIEGGIDQVSSGGITGHASYTDQPDLVPVIDVVAGDELVLTQACFSPEDGTQEGAESGWRFSIPWTAIGLEHAGSELIVRFAGTNQEIGRAKTPEDLFRYHRPAAVLAAELLGGSADEASEYHKWIRAHESREEAERAREYRADVGTDWPKLTVIVFGEGKDAFDRTCRSLRAQVYTDWEALLVGADQDLAKVDPRFEVVERSALDERVESDAFLTFVEAGDRLSPTALLHLGSVASASPQFALLYSDEDRFEPGSDLRGAPLFKAAWSLDLALAQDQLSRLALVRRDRITSIPLTMASVEETLLRLAARDQGPVVHLPFVLYHRSIHNCTATPRWDEIVRKVVDATPSLNGVVVEPLGSSRAKVQWPVPDPAPLVSLVVPTRDRVDLLRVAVDGFLHETDYSNLEVLIADNDSQEEETRSYLDKVATHPRVRVIPCPGPFNYSKINNLAVEQSKGSLIGLMNNDLKMLDPKWLRELASHAIRPDVGIVGAKLLYGDDTVQHAGVTLGIGVASHLYKSFPSDAEGRQGRLVLPQDLSAVTAACLLMRRTVWDEVGGLDEDFPVAYNDVDLCLKVRAAGYRILWTPDALVYHLESQSRGRDKSPEKRERLTADKDRLLARWGDQLANDPFHSPNLSSAHVDGRLSYPPRVSMPWQQAVGAA
jgi:O-antigen biosynthesis protein